MSNRPSWHVYFMKMAQLVSERSTCTRRQVGAVLVKDNQIIASGYNGAPKNVEHCEIVGCIREEQNIPSGSNHELCRGVHAEQNTIIQAAINGTSLENSVLYCTHFPCSLCAKMIINAEIETVYVLKNYNDDLSKKLFEESGTDVLLVDIDNNSLEKIV